MVLLLLSAAPPVFSDGGAMQARQETGAFVITVFVAPVPLRAGPIDLSLLLQDRITLNPILDAQVWVQLGEQRVQATHQQAQNKLLYAASFHLDRPGEWQYSVSVRRGPLDGALAGRLAAGPPVAKLESYWLNLAIPPLAIALFTAHQCLRRRRPGTGVWEPNQPAIHS
jgi:hypothetical protein